MLAGQEDSASASQPISSRNTSTPPTFWPGTEPYVCSLWDLIFFQRSPAFTLHKPEARPPWVTRESLRCGYLKRVSRVPATCLRAAG